MCVITQIAVGCDADILVLDSTTYELKICLCKRQADAHAGLGHGQCFRAGRQNNATEVVAVD